MTFHVPVAEFVNLSVPGRAYPRRLMNILVDQSRQLPF